MVRTCYSNRCKLILKFFFHCPSGSQSPGRGKERPMTGFRVFDLGLPMDLMIADAWFRDNGAESEIDMGVHQATYGTMHFGVNRTALPILSDREELPFWNVEDRMVALLDNGTDTADDVIAPVYDRYSAMAEEHDVDDTCEYVDDGVVRISVNDDDARLAATTVLELLSMLDPKCKRTGTDITVNAQSFMGLHKQAILTHGDDAFMLRRWPPSASWKDTTSAPSQHVRHKRAFSV